MVFPPAAATTVAAVEGEVDAAVLGDAPGVEVAVLFAGGLVQAFRRILVPRVAEPYIRNLRRPNRLAIPLLNSWLNQPKYRDTHS